jgi:hypothetical protein
LYNQYFGIFSGMSTKWGYIIGPVALVLVIGGLTGLLLSVDLAATTYALSTGMPVRLEAAWVLLRQGIVISLGPVVLTATPFQLAYCVLSVCLTCLAILICLVNCFFYRCPASSESKATTTQARKQTNKQSGVTNEKQ